MNTHIVKTVQVAFTMLISLLFMQLFGLLTGVVDIRYDFTWFHWIMFTFISCGTHYYHFYVKYRSIDKTPAIVKEYHSIITNNKLK